MRRRAVRLIEERGLLRTDTLRRSRLRDVGWGAGGRLVAAGGSLKDRLFGRNGNCSPTLRVGWHALKREWRASLG
jgi:hypothetical protein